MVKYPKGFPGMGQTFRRMRGEVARQHRWYERTFPNRVDVIDRRYSIFTIVLHGSVECEDYQCWRYLSS